jgi:hypothetical protein
MTTNITIKSVKGFMEDPEKPIRLHVTVGIVADVQQDHFYWISRVAARALAQQLLSEADRGEKEG